MHTTTMPGRTSELRACRTRLPSGPAAAAEARRQVRAAIAAWKPQGVDIDVAVLLTSELVTNAITHAPGKAVTLGVRCGGGQFRVDVHDASASAPVLTEAPADAEAGRGLMLVDTLATTWGSYPTPLGKAVYFTLELQPELADEEDNDTGHIVPLSSRRETASRPGA
jgi:anti-sigma regulatory factor (Ser/Thr protein kinase)